MNDMIRYIGTLGICSSLVVVVATPSIAQSFPDSQIATRAALPAQEARRAPSGDSAHTALQEGNLQRQESGVSSSELLAIRGKVQKALALYANWHLNTQKHNPWEVMHGMISYGVDSQLWRGAAGGEKVNAIAYVCWNGTCRRMSLLYLDGGRIRARKGPYVQGHHGQLLAILAQAHVKSDYPMRVGNQTFTIADLVETEKLTCRAGTELTFKLIGLTHYLETDAAWKSELGEDWSIPRLIREEIGQPILYGVACGGTHRLMGLSYAVYKRQKEDKPIDGQFARAHQYISDYHQYNFSLQNADGSFSTAWFQRRASQQNLNRCVRTTGHILEWLVFSLPEDQLGDPRVVRAADYLSGVLIDGAGRSWEVGPLGHALHGLSIYNRRLTKLIDGAGLVELARRTKAQMESATRGAQSAASLPSAATREAPRAKVQRRPPVSQSVIGSKSAEAETEGPILLMP